MRIMYITPNSILENTGGGIGARRIYYPLQNIAKNNNEVQLFTISLDLNLDYRYEINIVKNKIKDYLARLSLHSNYLYIEWKRLNIKKKIIDLNPDVIILGNSRLGFIAKELKKSGDFYIIGNFDNIEIDYIRGYSLKYKNILSKLFSIIERICVQRDEGDFIKNIDQALFLTQRDIERARDIYGGSYNKCILPICLSPFEEKLTKKNLYDINLVFLGSLWYGSNIHALKWFLENVWDELIRQNKKIGFIIGGSNPSQELIYYFKKFDNITVYPNFNKKSEIVPRNAIFVSPIQFGAGMKVKVAEALSMGLPIVGSEETLIGYEEAINDKLSKNVIFKANKPEEYINAINNIIEINNFDIIRNNAIKLFRKYYSLERAQKTLEDILFKK